MVTRRKSRATETWNAAFWEQEVPLSLAKFLAQG